MNTLCRLGLVITMGVGVVAAAWAGLPEMAVSFDGTGKGIGPLELPKVPQLQARAEAQPAIRGAFMVDGTSGGTMKPAQRAQWAFSFKDSNGRPVVQFDLLHEKPMHLIVVSADLDRFAHMHPALDERTGLFQITVNQNSADPDNEDAERAVPKTGPYFVFSEVQPKSQPAQTSAFDLTAEGPANTVPIVVGPPMPDGGIRKYFKADGGGGKEGDPYQVTLTIDKMAGMVHVSFNIQEIMTHGGQTMYMGVSNLENWLGMPGHAIMISAGGSSASTKIFRHLHAGSHGGGQAMSMDMGQGGHGGAAGPDVPFMLMGNDIPPVGTYRVWGQFKHRGKVVTFPFVIQL